jgi:hypothetical protein
MRADAMPLEDSDAEGNGEFSQADSVLVEWAAELADRLRAGEPIDPEALARQHPDRAAALRRLLPTIALMAQLSDSARSGKPGPSPFTPGVDPEATLPPELAERPDCEIKREIGRGGMGVVYLAHNTLMGRDEVLKVMGRRVVERPGVADRFLREIRAVARLRHPNIVTAYHASRLGDSLVLAMEYVPGLDLARLVKARGPMPVGFACFCARQVAVGLQHAHEQGLVHRDIKPGNLMFAREADKAIVKILDFGLAKVAREERVDGGLTEEQQALGTPEYMAPEQILDASSADIRADIYSLGCTLYFLLSGRPPYQASSLYDLYQAHISRDAEPLDAVRPVVPAALAALVAKMMAKDPAQRFQTPEEVVRALEPFAGNGDAAAEGSEATGPWADLLSPGGAKTGAVAVPMPTPVLPEPQRPPRRHRFWGAAAAVLLLLGASLGATEATGITHLATTVIRILVRDGTLVVETDDPGVRVTIEGDGGLVIRGAGPQEVRLRPGSYKVHSEKGGKPVPVDRELVTIARDDRQVVRVRLEAERPPKPKMAAKTEPPAFVVLGGKGVEVRTFDTLIEAVQASSDGDTIEIHGNGPFVTKQVNVGHSLTIRAASGSRPVIRLSPEASDNRANLISSGSQPLVVLEGLELWGTRLNNTKPGAWTVVVMARAAIANCRLMANGSNRLFQTGDLTRLTNCELVTGRGPELVFSGMEQTRLTIDNCLLAGMNLILQPSPRGGTDGRVQFMRSTYVGLDNWFRHYVRTPPAVRDQDRGNDAVAIDVSQSIICSSSLVDYQPQPQALALDDVNAYLRHVFRWRGESNVYHLSGSFLTQNLSGERGAPTRIEQLDQWRQFSGSPERGCIEGSVKFQGGDLLAKAAADPEHLTPEDFRLRPDSAGYRAGPDGQDLGADIDLVGPGPAYERWKQTPAFQQWLKDTGQSAAGGLGGAARAGAVPAAR